MLKKELAGALKSKRTWIIIFIIVLIPILDLAQVCRSERLGYKRAHQEEILEADRILKELCEEENMIFSSSWIAHPAKASYLSGSGHGHVLQMLLIWLLPLYVLNLFSDSSILEYKKGYRNLLLMRVSRKRHIFSKYSASFIAPFSVMAISLLINFGLAQILFAGGTDFRGLEVFADDNAWFHFMYTYPNRMYLFFILLTSICAGLCGIITKSIALLSGKYSVTYFVSFLLWMGLVMTKYSVVYLIQPFTEYGLDYMIRSAGLLFALTMILVLFTVCRKASKYDEL